jgi:dTDP-4-dehydrorhamnose reductase
VTDAAAVERLILMERPSLVVNCAVLGVDECERDPARARAINANAPRALAESANEVGAWFLHFSTNYVFDGEREGPYTEEDEPRPLSIYGSTKAEGEHAALAANPRCVVVRTSWVFGAGKRSFLSTAHSELLAGRRVRAIRDTWASVTYVEDLARRVEEILALCVGGLFHEEFAREAARLVGLDKEEAAPLIETVTESEMRRAAMRPRYTPLRSVASAQLGLAPLRDWREALADYVTNHKI